jgi:hypothetical protein
VIKPATPASYLTPVPEPDAPNTRHRVSGILVSMNQILSRRISGTYWERFLIVALPFPVLIVLVILARNGYEALSILQMVLIVGLGSVMIWILDCERARRRNPVEVIDGPQFLIGTDSVSSHDIRSITPLRWFKGLDAKLLEIDYRTDSGIRTVNVLSKPDPLGLFMSTPKTLRLLLRRHPELEDRVRPERTI